MIVSSSNFVWENFVSGELTDNVIINGNSLTDISKIPDNSIQMTITSPPYFGLRNYSKELSGEEIGQEVDVEDYMDNIYNVFKEVHRITSGDGVLFLNIGDTYASGCMNGVVGKNAKKGMAEKQARYGKLFQRKPPQGCKKKDLLGIPWNVAFMLRDMGWYLRSEIIWHKSHSMPEPQAKDRPWKAHEQIFLLSKSHEYKYNQVLNDKGAAYRDVWLIPPTASRDGHPAAFPNEIVKRCIAMGSNENDIVFDPFGGINTTGLWAKELRRKSIVIELLEDNCKIGEEKLSQSSRDKYYELF